MTPSIVVTGGPGGGKSTVAQRLLQRVGQRVAVVPEVATHLLGGFFPPVESTDDRRSVQRAIYHVQACLEAVHRARARTGQVLVLDRGLVDGAAYWPDGADAFFETMGTSLSRARESYSAVLFLETAAAGGHAIEGENPARREAREEAVAIDRRLHALWSGHARFRHVPHASEFEGKLAAALGGLQQLLDECV